MEAEKHQEEGTAPAHCDRGLWRGSSRILQETSYCLFTLTLL